MVVEIRTLETQYSTLKSRICYSSFAFLQYFFHCRLLEFVYVSKLQVKIWRLQGFELRLE
jgi:hypothetical protein